ncbi:hypothetical protein GOV10_04605 [Candidatus Woesearchaeota archaeon]|nr:hypothetical protein [Candidatus Woesearchaeota archaeon]
MKYGQAALEFSVMIGFSLILMIVLLVIVNALFSDSVEEERRQAMLSLGYALQDELIIASTVQPGYEHDFVVPEKLGRFTYTLSSTTTAFSLKSSKQTITFHTPETFGTFNKGHNTIKNDGAVISIT